MLSARRSGRGRRPGRRRRARPRARARRLSRAAPRAPLPVARDRLRLARRPATAPRRPSHRRSRRPDGDRDDEPPVVVASAVALAETVPDASLRPEGFSLKVGEEIDLTFCAELLAEAGYERVDQVEARGQFALRGDILDVFGATEDRAARFELFGDEIESIRWFSTFTQRSLGEADGAGALAGGRARVRAPDARGGGALRIRGRRRRSSSLPGRLVPRAARRDPGPAPRSSRPPTRRSSRPCARTGRT